MIRKTPAAATLAAALTLTLAPTLAPTAHAATTTVAAPAAKKPLTAKERARLHRLHVLHLRTLHNLHLRHLRALAARKAAQKAARHAAKGARARVIRAAERYLGQPYVYGRLDCSSLTQRAFKAGGVQLPRVAAAQARLGRPTSHPRPGDLVTWGSPAYHVAVYIGQGRIVVARHTGTVIAIQRVWGHPQYRSLLA